MTLPDTLLSFLAAPTPNAWVVRALKHPEDGAREGAELIQSYIIRVTEKAFDDFAGSGADEAANRRMLGLE